MSLPSEDLNFFLRRGYHVIPGCSNAELHETIRNRAYAIAETGPNATALLGDNVLPAIPELGDVLSSSPVHEALKSILGEEYLLHGHRHLHVSSNQEQMWHKDSYWGFRRVRHHRPRWCMLLYYPQETTLDMGPTHVLAGTQYWTIDSETLWHGEDILVDSSGSPLSMFVEGSQVDRRRKLKEAEQQFLGPSRASLLAQDVSLTVPAGACVLMHYDLFHRAGFRAKEDSPTRFMFKFQFIRTREPSALVQQEQDSLAHLLPSLCCASGSISPRAPPSPQASDMKLSVEMDDAGVFKVVDLRKHHRQLRRTSPRASSEPSDLALEAAKVGDAALGNLLEPVLDDVSAWLAGISHPSGSLFPQHDESSAPDISADTAAIEVEEGLKALRQAGSCCSCDEGSCSHFGEVIPGVTDEVLLVAAAYRLARSPGRSWLALLCGLTQESEALSRACGYGLAAAGPRATSLLIPLLSHVNLRVRCLASFALGECSLPSHELLRSFRGALECEEMWSWASANLLQALSCLAARARALGQHVLCERCVEICLPYLQPTRTKSLVLENACLVVLMSGVPGGCVAEEALDCIFRISVHVGDVYAQGLALEILQRHAHTMPSKNPEPQGTLGKILQLGRCLRQTPSEKQVVSGVMPGRCPRQVPSEKQVLSEIPP